ncbi:MAG: hypothetical protein QXO40_03925 [Candidatus Aenigmatarchaeota archaeon]
MKIKNLTKDLNEQIEIINKVDLIDFRKLLNNLENFESRAKVNEILLNCLENKLYLTSKKAMELIFIWFDISIHKLILTPSFVATSDNKYEIFEYFYDQLKPSRQTFDKRKGSPLVFLTQLLKNAINTYLRKKYKDLKIYYFSDIENENFSFEDAIGYESNFGFIISRDTARLVYDKFISFLDKNNISYKKINFLDFYIDFENFIKNLKVKIDFDIIFDFLKNEFQVNKKIKTKFKKFLKGK